MAHLDQKKSYEEFKERVLEGIKQHFPLKGGMQTLDLSSLEVADEGYDPDAIREQHKAKINGATWAAPVYGNFILKDNKTGAVLDERRMRIADLPLITRRYSHIIDGKEYQVNNQWQLKPGIYTKRRANGGLEAAFNIPKGHSFDVTFTPESKKFVLEPTGGSKIPLYPLLKQLGVDDDSLEHSWGKEVFAANKTAKGNDTAVTRFFRVNKKRQPKDAAEAEKYLVDTMATSALRPDATELTLGKKFQNVTGEALHLATNKLLKLQSGGPEDDRDSILFKDLRSVGDFAYDYLTHYETKSAIRSKINRKMFSAKDVRDVVKFDLFNDPLRRTFHENSEAELAKQINPVEMLGLAQQTTVLGPGGIQSQNAFDNMSNAKFVNPSTLGFLDPVRTPENEKSGGILRMPMGVQKQGKEPAIPLYNLKTHKTELVTPVQFHNSTVVLPDQVKWKAGKPHPNTNKVKASSLDDTMKEVQWKDADYVMRHPSQLFSATTNLIPFLGNNSGNRATYAGQHIEQAISLKHRQAPLVQVATPSDKKGESTFEELVGGFASHVSPVAGTVTAVKKDGIVVSHDGKEHEIQLYNNFPLNDPKAMLHSTPLVKVGDKVTVGQTVADSNYSKNGTLALGTNVRVAYIPYKGLNFEDGLVISKSAAQKFTSEHLHKPEVSLEKDTILDPKKFIVLHPDAFNQAQYKKLDDAGVVKVGQKVKSGDPLVLSMRPYQAKDRMSLQAIGRALSGRHVDTSLRWSSDHEGEVVGVHRDKDKITVHVSTAEPMQVGDKISNRHGGKGICVAIVDDDKMPRTKDGRHIEVAFNPTSVPGRMNLGQILETAASKVAEKTGKTFVVHNFSNEPQLDRVKAELKKNGLTDQEELTDPETGMKLGKALVGPQHMFKLVHQIDKKESARSGMAVPGSEPESYDSNLMPASGGHTGGQSLGALDLYVLLAHGARATIREAQTFKSEGPDPNPNPAKQWSSQHHDVWNAIQQGEPIPAPKSTFAWQKFTDMLRASGVDVEKKGHTLQLVPLTDRQILKMSNGELKKPGEVVYPSLDKNGEPRPKAGGILDEKITGGHGGKAWSHIALAEPIPNPVFERAIQKLTGLTANSYMDIVHGQKAVTSTGSLVELGTANAVTGGPGVVRLLEKIDVDKELKSSEKALQDRKLPTDFAHRSTVPAVDNLMKKVKYLRALKQAGLKPTEAYVLHNLPVIPPAMRPISMLKDGSVKWGDLNELYKAFGAINTAMKDPSQAKLEDDQRQDLRQSLYDGVSAIIGVGAPRDDQKHKGILHQIAGDPAKEGYFQDTLMARRQDMSMRSTIVPNPSLGLDEVGLPRDKALTLYKPFVVRKLVEMGAAEHALEARKLVENNDVSVNRALELVAKERPVLLKRDPALHRHSIQGFQPKIVSGKAIQIHPLVTSGFSADFDGNCFVGSTEVVVEILRTTWAKTLEASTASENTMKFGPTTEVILQTVNAVVVKTALQDIPYNPASRRVDRNGASVYALPPGMKVWTYGHGTGGSIFSEVTDITIEDNCETAKVTMRRGMSVEASINESLCVYDHETGKIKDLSPAEAVGRLSPILRKLPAVGVDHDFEYGWMLGAQRDQIDIVPVPFWLLELLCKAEGPLAKLPTLFKSVRAAKYKRSIVPYFMRDMAQDVLRACMVLNIENIDQWAEVVLDRDVHWDLVTSVEPLGPQRVFDLVVPETKVFAVNGGLVVWDTMSVYVPISNQAVEEARKMMPSNNLYNEASGRVTYTPTLESALGLYKLSRVTNAGTHKFSSPVDAIKAVNAGKLTVNDLATIDGISTTVGRVLLANALPESMQNEYLTKHDRLIDKKGLDQLFTALAKNHREDYGVVANKLKDLGNGASSGAIPIFSGLKGPALIKAAETKDLKYVSIPVHSLSLEDFTPDTHTRDRVLGAAQREVNVIESSQSIPTKDKERRAVDVWVAASNKMDQEHLRHIDKDPSNLAMMLRAGVKPSLTQYKQMVLAPVLMADATGKPIPIPITKSYSEGLDIASYWTQQQGARRGTVMKVQEVREPGTLSKRMVQTTMGMVVAQDDCGTKRGIALPVSSRDVQDRILVNDASIKDVHVSAGTQLTPALVDQLRAADKSATLVVRSPLKCEHAKGLCSKCAGLRSDGNPYELGTNVGILAAQALGERSVQLTMKAFHSGGVVQSNAGSRAVDDFARVEQLMQLTDSIPNESTLAMRSGKIERIEKDRTGAEIWIGGVRHHVGKDTTGMALHEDLATASKAPGYIPWQPPKVGQHVEAGETLSDPNRTVVNPRDLYRATNNMERVQNYLVDELHRVYGGDVRRQHVETLVHAMGNLTKIRHPGDSENVLIGEFRPVNQIRAINRDLIKAGKHPIEHSPVLKGVDNMPLEVQEDWLAKLQHIKLRSTLLDAAAVGATADLHGLHPVPAISYGAELGLNETHSTQPGLGHLKNVPTFNY